MTQQPGVGEWYEASDGNWYCWPDPTPHSAPPSARPAPPPTSAPTQARTASTAIAPRTRHRWPWVVVALVALLGIGGGATYFVLTRDEASPARHEIGGSLVVGDIRTFSNDGCFGNPNSGFSDLRAGASVSIKNEAGVVIATGSLGTGVIFNGGGVARCRFPFVVRDVPDAAFYQFDVSNRTGVRRSKADLEANGWQIELTI